MPQHTKYPYRVYNFKVDIGTDRAGAFSECTGLDSSNDVIDYREGVDPQNRTKKLPGLPKYSNITLKYGVIDGELKTFQDWIQNTRDGSIDHVAGMRHPVTITLCDDNGNPKMEWELANAWCTKWTGAGLNAKGNEVAVESLEIAHEGINVWKAP